MRARILDASIRVLREQGALAFTTTRVADEAGISVGSLYQYFPNKHALVAALHERDIADGVERVLAILDRADIAPRRRLHEIVHWFFETEAEEAATLGAATGEVGVFLRDGTAETEHAELVAMAFGRFVAFIAAGTTNARASADPGYAAQFAMTTIEAIGKALAARRPSAEEIAVWATDTSTMLAEYLGFEAS